MLTCKLREAPTAKPMLCATKAVRKTINANIAMRVRSSGWPVIQYVVSMKSEVHISCIGISANVMAT